MASLMELPAELKQMIVDLMGPTDLRQTRLTCTELQQITFDQFAKLHFQKICILPTKKALNTVKEIYSHEKFTNLAVEVDFCSSIYRFSDYSRSKKIVEGDSPYEPPNKVCDEFGPFDGSRRGWRSVTNRNVQYLTHETFYIDLHHMMHALELESIIVHRTYPKVAEDSLFTDTGARIIGRRRLLQATGKDPLQQTQQRPTWDTSEPDIHTMVCDEVLWAAFSNGQLTSSAYLGWVQPRYMSIMSDRTKNIEDSPTWTSIFMLEVDIRTSEDITTRDDEARLFLDFLRKFPELSFLRFECIYGKSVVMQDLSLPLLDYLDAGVCNELDIDAFSSLLTRHKSTLHDLSATVYIWEDAEREQWRQIFEQLATPLILEKVSIELNKKHFEGENASDTAKALAALSEWVMDCPDMYELDSDLESSDDEVPDDVY